MADWPVSLHAIISRQRELEPISVTALKQGERR